MLKKHIHPLPHAGFISKTQVPQRGYWSEPEEQPEPEPKLTVKVFPATYPVSILSEPSGVEEKRSIFESISTEEQHKTFREDIDVQHKVVCLI